MAYLPKLRISKGEKGSKDGLGKYTMTASRNRRLRSNAEPLSGVFIATTAGLKK
jgi:hypothetical protein